MLRQKCPKSEIVAWWTLTISGQCAQTKGENQATLPIKLWILGIITQQDSRYAGKRLRNSEANIS